MDQIPGTRKISDTVLTADEKLQLIKTLNRYEGLAGDFDTERWVRGSEIDAIINGAINKFEDPSIDDQIAELLTHGWKPKTSTIWLAPNGTLHLGPHGAWKTMRLRGITI